jgi:hypothetical protein
MSTALNFVKNCERTGQVSLIEIEEIKMVTHAEAKIGEKLSFLF